MAIQLTNFLKSNSYVVRVYEPRHLSLRTMMIKITNNDIFCFASSYTGIIIDCDQIIFD